MSSKIWLSSPHMGGTEKKYVDEAFAENWIAPLGPNVTGFENALETYLGEGKHVAALSSGTAAIHLALIQCGVGSGDEVICQSFTFCGSSNPIKYLNAVPVFVDSESDTWNIDPELLEEAIKDRIQKGIKPKAILIVHLYGMPCKIDEVTRIASMYEIPLIEDAAEALGSTFNGQPCGTFGDFGILSFNGNKIITTSGGGALVCNTQTIKEKTVFLATQARDIAPHYQHSEVGYNYRLSNISAGIGRGQMEVLDERVSQRRAMNSFYRSIFEGRTGVTFQEQLNKSFFCNYWLTSILIDQETAGFTSKKLKEHLDSYNIESRPLWKPMHMQPVYDGAPYYGGNVSENFFKNGICLPSGSNLTEDEKIFIKKKILEFFDLKFA